MNVIKEYAKAIAAAVVGVLVNLAIQLFNGSTPWPQTTGDWIGLAVSAFGPAIAAVFVPNKISDKQVEKDPTVVRVDAPSAPNYPAPRGHRNSTWD